MAEQQQDVDTLRRRGRRRLIGAVALVLLAVIVLPMIFDPAPRQSAPPVSVRIPGEDESPFTPKVASKPPEKKAEPEKKAAEEKAAEERKAAAPKETAARKEAASKKPADAERARAEAALASGEFVVPVGTFSSPREVIAKLSAAKIPYYTESLQGNLTRVRAGPFASKVEAEKALEALRGLGLKPGNVTAKS